MINVVLEALNENGINYEHVPENGLIEMDLSGQDRLYHVMKILSDNLENWCYDLLLNLEINVQFAFEKVTINY